jgi:glucose/arabinose dehydrogenase
MWFDAGRAPELHRKLHMTRVSSLLAFLFIAVIVASAEGSVLFEPIATGLDRPVQVVTAYDGSQSFFVAQLTGVILRFAQAGAAPTVFLDLSSIVSCCSNGGLLSVVFDPRFAQNGRLYVLYVDLNGDTVLARVLAPARETADPSTVEVLLVADQPTDNLPNHHGGTLQFGPDGMLYVSIGDGGAYTQVTNRAQDVTHFLGKLLRIDADLAFGYAIPADNPYAGVPGARAEIWSFGLRNPWRYSFDRVTGALYLADVGQDSWEEVNVLTLAEAKRANFGWPILEGNHCFPPGTSCSTSGFLLPTFEYSHAFGCSATGGYRYRGIRWPQWSGVYFYGDWCTGILWSAIQRTDGSWATHETQNTGKVIVSFGEDDSGELYLVDYAGAIYRMAPGLPPRRRSASH